MGTNILMNGGLFMQTPLAVVRTAEGYPVAVHMEPTKVPGLVLVPAVRSDGIYTGGWLVLHVASGKPVGGELDHPDIARMLAADLARGPLASCDWRTPSAPRKRYAERILEVVDAAEARQQDRRKRIAAAFSTGR